MLNLAPALLSIAVAPAFLTDAPALPGIATATETATQHQAEAQAPQLLVIKFHADWCGKCKALATPLADAKDSLAEEPVLFLELNFTDTGTTQQSEYLASIVGLGETWTEYERRTGFALLIEPNTGTVLETLGKPDADAIVEAVKKHL